MDMLFGILNGNSSFAENLVVLLAFVSSMLIALVGHEFAHAYAALKQGDPTAKLAGRVTLNPKPHIDPLGLLCLCIAGMGWAKPVPVNPFNYRNFRRGNFWVSIVGVLTNFIVGFVCSLGYFLLLEYANINNLALLGLLYFFLFCMVINISLMVFNLLPIPPLDGYNVLLSLTKPNNRFMTFMRQNALVVLLIVLIVSTFSGGIFWLRDIIILGFDSFWGLVF